MKKNLAGTPLERASRWMFTRILSGLSRTLRDEDLSVAQLAALHVIDDAGELGQSLLAAELGLSPSATSRLVEGLVQRGLVERHEAAHDRRARALRLSPRGAAMLDEVGHARATLIELVTRPFPRPMIKQFLENMERFRAAYRAERTRGRKEA